MVGSVRNFFAAFCRPVFWSILRQLMPVVSICEMEVIGHKVKNVPFALNACWMTDTMSAEIAAQRRRKGTH